MDIKDKLRLIELVHLREELSISHQPFPVSGQQIDRVLDGKIKESPSGSFFYYEKDFPLDYQHGSIRLEALLNHSSALLSLVGKNDDLGGVDLKRSLFIDTETSGLSGGAGTFAFLVGIGYFTEHSFRVVQFFMNDFTEEHPLLHELNQLVDKQQMVVSYNGKCFDVPVLDSRNVYHRFQSPFTQLLHLDLLHSVRRLWKKHLPDCSLGTAEKEILKVVRRGDVPGYLIPQIYFNYLQTKNPYPLKPIFYHNEQDVLSMVALLARMLQLLENPLVESGNVAELLAIGRIYEGMNQLEKAIELYEKSLDDSICDNRRPVLFRLAFNHKKLHNWTQAAEVWHTCLATEPYHPIPYIELAKFYEHRENDYVRAKRLVDKALSEINVLQGLNRRPEWQHYKNDLDYRDRRLRKKIDK